MKHHLAVRACVVAVPLLFAAPVFAADAAPSGYELITAKVQAALAADKRLQVKAPLEVKTRGGVVALSGDVETPSMVYRAVETTRNVEGVKEVDTHHLEAR